jgi:choline/glycine/proline betaine transport protein
MEGVIAAVLLVGGGLATLQTASVSTGLPFAIVLLISVYSMYIGFSQEIYVEKAVEKAVITATEKHRMQEVISNVISENEQRPSS